MAAPQKNRIIIIISLVTITAGLVVIGGWIFHAPALQQIVPGFISMVFNTALCFVLFGSALLFTQYPTVKYQNVIFFLLSLPAALIGLITLLQFLFKFNTGLDELFVTDPARIAPGHPFPGRMAFNTSISILLLGTGFILVAFRRRVSDISAQYLFHAVTVLSAIALIGDLYGASLFNTLLYVSTMATHTAILFLILSVTASLLNPSIGFASLFTGTRVGNQMARRLFSLILLMVISFGGLRVLSARFPLFSLEIWVSLLAVCFLLISLLLIWDTAGWLNKIDKKRSEAEAEVKLMNAELEKRVAERSAEILKSEEKYRSLIEQASDAIYVVNFDGHFTDVNNSMCKMMGYTRDELLELKVDDIIDPEELKTDPIKHGPRKPEEYVIRERRLIRKDGSVFYAEINVKSFQDNRILVIARDITDRKRIESDLREAELKFRTIAEKSIVGVYIVQNGKFVYVNPRFAEVFGYKPDELINTVPVETIIHENHRHITTENVRRRIAGEVESVHYEVMGLKKDGTSNWVEFYGSRATMGGIPTIIGSMIDVTERKEAEELILKEKILSDTIINSLPGIFYLHNDKGQYLRWNNNFEVVTGYSTREVEQLNAGELIAPEDRETVARAIEKVFMEGYAVVEANGISKNGARIPFLLTGIPIFYEGQRCLLGTGIDISSRIKAEEELRSSEQKYKLLFDSNPVPLWMIVKDTRVIIDVNEAAARLYGYTRDELQNRNISVLRLPEDREEQVEGYKRDMSETSGDYGIVRHVKKDGSIMYVHIMAHDIIFEGRSVRLSSTNDVTEQLEAEIALQKSEANLQTILNTTDTAYAVFDNHLKVLSFNQKGFEFVVEQYHHVPVKGDNLADFFPRDRFSQFSELIKLVGQGQHINYEIDYPNATGGKVWYDVRLSPIMNEQKEIFGTLMALYDITERKASEQRLKSAYDSIQSHIESIKDMAWKQSHLIRSPIANLKALADMLKEHPSDTQAMTHLKAEVDRLDGIILEMAKVAAEHDV